MLISRINSSKYVGFGTNFWGGPLATCNYLLALNSWLPVFIRNRCFWFFRLSEETVRAENREIDSPKKISVGRCWPKRLQIKPKIKSWLFKITRTMQRKALKAESNYWDVTPNPWITGFRCCNCHKLIIS